MVEETYHQRIKGQKREAAVQAAMELFMEQGYERTSLQQVAARAGVSTATVFKRFQTKAALFESVVEHFWATDVPCEGMPPMSDLSVGLRKIGLDYAHRMRRPEMQAIYRLIVAEAPRFPDLGAMLFDTAKGPFLIRLNKYLSAQIESGSLQQTDITTASLQFLAMISGQAFWPSLLGPGCGGSDLELVEFVEEAVATILCRLRAP